VFFWQSVAGCKVQAVVPCCVVVGRLGKRKPCPGRSGRPHGSKSLPGCVWGGYEELDKEFQQVVREAELDERLVSPLPGVGAELWRIPLQPLAANFCNSHPGLTASRVIVWQRGVSLALWRLARCQGEGVAP
jgi:hypothetical protein